MTRRGILRPKVLLFGPKQGPGLFQGFMDSVFGGLRDKAGDEFSVIFMDDVCISTEGFDGDTDDDIVNRHIEHCTCFLEAARKHNIQFKLSKCKWACPEVSLLGFVLGNGARRVDPAKAKALRDWPDPKCIDDIISFRAFANFIKEFIPSFHEHDALLRPFTKKGAKFNDYLGSAASQKAFSDLRDAVAEDAMLHVPDYEAAADANSGRPFELYIDASDFAWGCVLSQRAVAGGAPRPIAVFSRSFTETEQAWSAFERELFGLREGLASAEPYIKGFKVVVLTDHRNNLFTGSLLANRRVNKKLLRWAIDLEELGDSIQRVWIKGTDNVLGDPPSRNPADRDVCRRLKIPSGPVRRIIKKMFEAPIELDEELESLNAFLEGLDNPEPPKTVKEKGATTTQQVEAKTPRTPVTTAAPAANASLLTAAEDKGGTYATESTQYTEPAHTDVDDQTETAQPADGAAPGLTATQEGSTGTLDISASWPSSLVGPSEPDDANDDASFLYCAGSHGARHKTHLPLLSEMEEESVRAVTFTSTRLDSVYPRQQLVQFLPARSDSSGGGASAGHDPRAPRDPRVLPYRIAHVVDARGENFVVQYVSKHMCHDGVLRKSMWYQCKTKACAPGTPEHAAGHLKAEAAAWAHVEQVLARGEEAENVDGRCGTGELHGSGRFRHHGDPHEDFCFKVHPRRPDFNRGDLSSGGLATTRYRLPPTTVRTASSSDASVQEWSYGNATATTSTLLPLLLRSGRQVLLMLRCKGKLWSRSSLG